MTARLTTRGIIANKEIYKQIRINNFLMRTSIRKTKKGCILWKGYKNKTGYGELRGFDKKTCLAHRFSYEYFFGKFNKKLFVCHSCDNPLCVNPDHLFLGNPKINAQDRILKNRIRIKGYKLKISQVKKIKNLIKEDISLKIIANKYSIHIATVRLIKRGKIWKNI